MYKPQNKLSEKSQFGPLQHKKVSQKTREKQKQPKTISNAKKEHDSPSLLFPWIFFAALD